MVNSIGRNTYIVRTNGPKSNNTPLTIQDYMQVGYVAGRCGVNLSGNPYEQNPMQYTSQGTIVSINPCTSEYFEKTLIQSGINFDKIV